MAHRGQRGLQGPHGDEVSRECVDCAFWESQYAWPCQSCSMWDLWTPGDGVLLVTDERRGICQKSHTFSEDT